MAQDRESGRILMVAFADREAVEKTLSTGHVHYWSRERERLWMKGETSGHVQVLEGFYVDCDEDALVVLVSQKGPACHLGRRSCFFRKVDERGEYVETHQQGEPPVERN